MSTYEEIQSKLMPRPKRYNENDPSIYSTSCQLDLPALQSLLACCMKHHPKAFIAVGTTEGSCGLSQLTAERNPEKKMDMLIGGYMLTLSHIDILRRWSK